ncbi:ATP-binding cassette domain-containing protein [Cytobacillus sp. FSL R5-0569]|uniref:ATP-binding cassette domain-containing protein n=1 Tax=Cytobacillus TaxID=2675230 RepID=UPI00278702CB|nr:ATP-binding cassette domain-containing protein [Cytobacillus kochii]MDQ0186597.1 peptide/nickel transport system ATP-binding protein/oligopeptide transport system ATP-binding protein [Cytobacillus kochii]
MQSESLLDVSGLTKVYGNKGSLFVPRKEILAVNKVSFSIKRGETFGLIGESGSGKTTIGRMVMRLIDATAGDIQYKGKSILSMKKGEMDKLRNEMQIIFQDSGSAFNPRKTIGEQILHPLNKFYPGNEAQIQYKKVIEMLDVVGLRSDFYHRYPHELSGGQRQRAGIARALIVKPKFLVLDEPVSALDVSVKAQIMNLLIELQKEFQLTYLFIAHNLDLVAYFCDRVAVLSKGKMIETAPTIDLFRKPQHEVTQKLLSSILTLDGDLGDYYRKQSVI